MLYDKDEHIKNLIDTGYGGLEKLKKDILFDFFRSAFDGSGADNFFDAGRYTTFHETKIFTTTKEQHTARRRGAYDDDADTTKMLRC